MLAWVAMTVMGLEQKVRFFCGDEMRLGLKTIGGRKITARGIKPIGKVQWHSSSDISLRHCGTEYGRTFLL